MMNHDLIILFSFISQFASPVFALHLFCVYLKFRINILKPLTDLKKKNAQVGIRIRVDCVTGNHDRPLHYLGTLVQLIPPPRFEPGTSR